KILRYSLLLFLTVLPVAVSCELFEKKYLESSPSSLVLTNKGVNEQLLTIKTGSEWTVTSSDSWVRITPRSGVGEQTVSISALYNNSGKERKATLTIATTNKSPLTSSVAVCQPASYLISTPRELNFEKSGGTQKIKISSNVEWSMKGVEDAPLLSFSPDTGLDDVEVTVTASENSERLKKMYVVQFVYGGGLSEYLNVNIDQQYNEPPEKPSLMFPQDKATNMSRIPEFRWFSSDLEGDQLVSTFYYSADKAKWDSVVNIKSFELKMPAVLSTDTEYYWYVSVDDGHSGVTKSDMYSFTTGKEGVHAHGTYVVVQESTKSHPNILIFLGDGFTEVDLKEEDGDYDKYMDMAIDAYFDVEPYKSYRDYFKIYKMYAVSEEEGASFPKDNIYKKTAFSAKYTGEGTGMACDNVATGNFISVLEDVVLDQSLVVMVVNQQKYAGTCVFWKSGRSIALCPISNLSAEEGSQTNFKSVVLHEAAGHGFAKLSDEYVSKANEGKMIPDDEIEKIINYQTQYGYYSNVSVIGDTDSVQWASFIGRKGYEAVNIYEGGHYYPYGVWRPESGSCMINNVHYFNAPSRYAIVKKIVATVGETITFEQFVEQDLRGSSASEAAVAALVLTKTSSERFIPLAPPVLVDK
ncbi:MAG: M64 family metallopeptidase, partial [Bacteroidales bacterium]|nr:M64 family metallopeptidase [Bacteroidales bacterium]